MALPFAIVNNGLGGLQEGDVDTARLTNTGGLVVGAAHGEHYEATSRGGVFFATNATSVAPGTAITTTIGTYLHNPLGSDVFLSLIAVSMGYISGTLGAGATYLTSHVGKAVANPTGTAIAPRKTRLGSSCQGQALAFTTATVATQYIIRPLWSFGAILATSDFPVFQCKNQINGEVVVPPGFGVGIHSIAAAGTTPLVRVGVSWEEIPMDMATLIAAGDGMNRQP